MEALLTTTFDLSPRISLQNLLELLVKNRSNEDPFKAMAVLRTHKKCVGSSNLLLVLC